MAKFCIFCGEHPIDKNKEHIIPQWLIKMTGDPKRPAILGVKDGKEIKISWMNYVFPACTVCNSEFAEIEGRVKSILTKLLEEKPINHAEMDLFMDWLDKVRIGIWLGQAQLLGRKIDPNFYINSRVGDKDRLLLIYKIDDNEKGIKLIGAHSAIFEYVPSCFSLIINNLVFFNYSKEFILAKNLGFPYLDDYSYNSNFEIHVENLLKGKYELTYPILNGQIIKPCIKFYQSILNVTHGYKRPFAGKGYGYFNKNCLTFTKDLIKSRIFISDEISNHHMFWEKDSKHKFIHTEPFKREFIQLAIVSMVFHHQIQSANDALDHIQKFNEEERKKFIELYSYLIDSNQEICKEIDDALAPIIMKI